MAEKKVSAGEQGAAEKAAGKTRVAVKAAKTEEPAGPRVWHEAPEAGPMPGALQRLATDARVTVRRGGEPLREGKCVLYWMQRAERGIDNPALDKAIELGNELRLPVVAFFSAISNFPHANWRHYHFLGQGLVDVEQDLRERNVELIVRRPPENQLEKLVVELGAAVVVGDENPMREPERWRQVFAHRISVPFWTVDADTIVPMNSFDKHYYAAVHFRPKFFREMAKYLDYKDGGNAQYTWEKPSGFTSFKVGDELTEGWGPPFDRSLGPVDTFTGGTHTGLKLLRDFVDNKLADYDTVRNRPDKDGTSRISPYLHYGHLCPITITRAIGDAVASGKCTPEARDAYYGEVLAWRELCVNFVRFVPEYDNIGCAPEWARESLKKHAKDPRPHLYTRDQMEAAETHDDMWNAAQLQARKAGWMHNQMRMYWGKKILEWSANAAEAFENCVYLNDRYFLDGRDPNGYANIAWAVCGVHDRPWIERPIFGKVRYMSRESSGRKLNASRYIKNIEEGRVLGD